jgi:hypothetical protein
MIKHFKVTLTDNQGFVIAEYTIGKELESDYDIEDLDSEPEHDYYLQGNYSDMKDLGSDIEHEANIALEQENNEPS